VPVGLINSLGIPEGRWFKIGSRECGLGKLQPPLLFHKVYIGVWSNVDMLKFKKSKDWMRFGHFIFLVGLMIAVIGGVVLPSKRDVAIILILIGFIVGLINIRAKEADSFLIAYIGLIVSAGALELIPVLGILLKSIVDYILALTAPAAIVVALIRIYQLAEK